MNQSKAFCVELKRNISIDEAHFYYFSQDEGNRKRLNFRCGDPKCREIKDPLVVGVLYDRKDEPGNKLKSPHFREHSAHPHIDGCTWINDLRQISEEEKEKQNKRKKSGYISSDLGLVFKPNHSTSSIKKVVNHDLCNDIHYENDDGSKNKRKSIDINENKRPETSKFIQTVASRYISYTEHQKKTIPLSIENKHTGSFYSVCLPVFAYHPRFRDKRIYHGQAKITELDNVFFIEFLSKFDPDGSKDNRNIYPKVKILKKWLNENDRHLGKRLHELKNMKVKVFCYFNTPPVLNGKAAQFEVDNPAHIEVMTI